MLWADILSKSAKKPKTLPAAVQRTRSQVFRIPFRAASDRQFSMSAAPASAWAQPEFPLFRGLGESAQRWLIPWGQLPTRQQSQQVEGSLGLLEGSQAWGRAASKAWSTRQALG